MSLNSALMRETYIEAEQAVCVLCANYPDLVPLVDSLDPRHFSVPKWRAVWGAIVDLHGQGALVDGLTVADAVPQVEPADVVAGIERYSELSIERYAAIVRDAHITRQVALRCSESLEAIKAGLSGVELLSLTAEGIAGVDVDAPDGALTVGELVTEEMANLKRALEDKANGRSTMGVPTGMLGLDKRLGGLQRGVVTVIAARPGMGKSALAMSVCDGASALGHGAHIFSLEDTRSAYAHRVIARLAGVPVEKLKSLDFNAGDLDNIRRALPTMTKRDGWLVDDCGGIDAQEIVRRVRRHAKRNGTAIVVVDYLNLLKLPAFTKRHEALGEAMLAFATAAKTENVAFVVLAQLNRECERREPPVPILSDLKDSGDIEEKAKCVLMLYRPFVYDSSKDPRYVEVLVRKNNQGATGVVEARFDPETIKIH